MSGSIHHEEVPTRVTTSAEEADRRRDETLDDEEKVLAGRLDVNMPALLTRDVQGG